jgi:hypothetical protein
MSDHTQPLLHQALTLSDDERAELAAELLISLEQPLEDDAAAVEHAWAEELERRALAAQTGNANGEEWHQLRERVSRALTDG